MNVSANQYDDPFDAMQALPAHTCATVCLAGDQHYVVAAGARRLRAVRAASCLLAPEVGDEVAWWPAGDDEGYILAVLTRAGSGPQQWLFDGDAEIGARNGSLSLHADETVALRAPRMTAEADELSVRTKRAQGIFDTLETFGRSVVSTVSSWRMIGAELATVFDRVSQYARHSRRVTEGIDHVSAATVDLQASQVLNMQAENVMAGGSRLVKVQGKQIHLG